MIEKKQLRIELTGAEAEKIVSDWVAARMIEHGYKLDYSRNEDGAWPDTFWRGEEVPNVQIEGQPASGLSLSNAGFGGNAGPEKGQQ